jgi:hypothetical protein
VPLHPAPAALPESEVVTLRAGGRVRRLLAVAVVLAMITAGSIWGNDDTFPFGPFRMYSTRADPDAPVISTRVVGLTAAGEEVKLSGGAVGLRRAEFEGQLDRITERPELLGLLADSFAEAHPSAPELTAVQVVQRHIELVDGARTGAYEDQVLVEHDLEDGT